MQIFAMRILLGESRAYSGFVHGNRSTASLDYAPCQGDGWATLICERCRFQTLVNGLCRIPIHRARLV